MIGAAVTSLALIGAAFALSVLPALRAPLPPATRSGPRWHDALTLFACSPVTLFLAAASGLLISSFYALGAVFAERMGFGTVEIALFVSCTLFAPVLLQLPMGWAADILGRPAVVAGGSALGAASALTLVAVAPHGFVAVTALAALTSGLGQPLYALALGRLLETAKGPNPVTAATGGLVAYNAGTIIGPLGAAQMIALTGPLGLFAWCALVLLLAVVSAAVTGHLGSRRCCPI